MSDSCNNYFSIYQKDCSNFAAKKEYACIKKINKCLPFNSDRFLAGGKSIKRTQTRDLVARRATDRSHHKSRPVARSRSASLHTSPASRTPTPPSRFNTLKTVNLLPRICRSGVTIYVTGPNKWEPLFN